jgi:hypothetical protein
VYGATLIEMMAYAGLTVFLLTRYTYQLCRNVTLPFQWSIYKPDMSEPEDPEGKKKDKVPDVDSVFSVHPPNGTLPPAAEMEFKITFAPPVVSC